jgi:hypothetical protein
MRRRTGAGKLLFAAVLVLVGDLVVVAQRTGEDRLAPLRAAAVERPTHSSSTTPTTIGPTTTAAPPTTAPAPTTTAAPIPSPADRPVRAGSWTDGPYEGVGVWVDVYDWTAALTGGNPRVTADSVDQMAAAGIQTLYIQTAHRKLPGDIAEPDRLLPIIQRAHDRGIAVVAWYLPTFEDLDTDFRRLMAATTLPVDGLGVDIESLTVANAAERTQRLLTLSTALRQAMGGRAISAITQSAVIMQMINPGFWPGFPWQQVGQLYDVIIPMSYWSERSQPEWHSGERYTGTDIDLIRQLTGRLDMPIHVAGGIANGITIDDVSGMVRAIQARGVLGGSLYDWSTSQPDQWNLLKALRIG